MAHHQSYHRPTSQSRLAAPIVLSIRLCKFGSRSALINATAESDLLCSGLPSMPPQEQLADHGADREVSFSAWQQTRHFFSANAQLVWRLPGWRQIFPKGACQACVYAVSLYDGEFWCFPSLDRRASGHPRVRICGLGSIGDGDDEIACTGVLKWIFYHLAPPQSSTVREYY